MKDNCKELRTGKVELLAPAGSFESLRAAVNAGADAVYMGGALFSARAYADNPDADKMKECIDFCHFYGKKIYLAVNTLLKPAEMENELEKFLAPVYENGIDAVIVQDTGVMAFISRYFPDLPIHISTQAAVTMAEGANLLKSRFPQIDRVVPARELSLDELKRFRKDTDLDIEVFIHGALCVSCSGLCLMSSNIGERSGNRGRCAQPCRKQYLSETDSGITGSDYRHVGSDMHRAADKNSENRGAYYLSMKDQCLLDNIHELIDAGMNSFKIEGRMKSPEYTAGCVAVYRKAIDEYYGTEGGYAYEYVQIHEHTGDDISIQDDGFSRNYIGRYREGSDRDLFIDFSGLEVLMELYNRGGFNEGYLHKHNGQEMMSLERPNHSGTEVGAVTSCSGREASISFFREVYPGDVIEIRRGNEKIYEFTLGRDVSLSSASGINNAQNSIKGKIKCLTMKEKRALKGDRVYRTRCEILLNTIRERYIDRNRKLPVEIFFRACVNDSIRMCMKVCDGQARAEVTGGAALPAQKAPLDEATVIRQLEKLNDTDFIAVKTECDIEGAVFVPVSELNRLRREAAEKLKKIVTELNHPARGASQPDAHPAGKPDEAQIASDAGVQKHDCEPAVGDRLQRIVSIWQTDQLEKALSGAPDGIYFNLSGLGTDEAIEAYRRSEAAGVTEFSFGLPYVLRAIYYEKFGDILEILIKTCPDAGFLVRNLEEISLIRSLSEKHKCRIPMRLDYTLYSMNHMAQKWGAESFTVSPELTIEEVGELMKAGNSEYDASACPEAGKSVTRAGSAETQEFLNPLPEMIVYGSLPSMITAQCVYKNLYGSCRKDTGSKKGGSRTGCESDGKQLESTSPLRPLLIGSCGHTFKTLQLCDFCTNIIYNSGTLDNTDRLGEIKKSGIRRVRLEYVPGDDETFTRGHFQKGVI